MTEQFKEYINNINLESLFIGDVELVQILEKVYTDGYKQGWKNAVEASPISESFTDPEEDEVWEKAYAKWIEKENKKL